MHLLRIPIHLQVPSGIRFGDLCMVALQSLMPTYCSMDERERIWESVLRTENFRAVRFHIVDVAPGVSERCLPFYARHFVLKLSICGGHSQLYSAVSPFSLLIQANSTHAGLICKANFGVSLHIPPHHVPGLAAFFKGTSWQIAFVSLENNSLIKITNERIN